MRVVSEDYGDEWVICDYCEHEIKERPVYVCPCGAEVHHTCIVPHRNESERHKTHA